MNLYAIDVHVFTLSAEYVNTKGLDTPAEMSGHVVPGVGPCVSALRLLLFNTLRVFWAAHCLRVLSTNEYCKNLVYTCHFLNETDNNSISCLTVC